MYDSRSCKRASLAVPPLLAAAAAARKLSFFSCPVKQMVTAWHALGAGHNLQAVSEYQVTQMLQRTKALERCNTKGFCWTAYLEAGNSAVRRG